MWKISTLDIFQLWFLLAWNSVFNPKKYELVSVLMSAANTGLDSRQYIFYTLLVTGRPCLGRSEIFWNSSRCWSWSGRRKRRPVLLFKRIFVIVFSSALYWLDSKTPCWAKRSVGSGSDSGPTSKLNVVLELHRKIAANAELWLRDTFSLPDLSVGRLLTRFRPE